MTDSDKTNAVDFNFPCRRGNLCIWLVGYQDLNLVLGPLRAENLGSLGAF